MSPLDNGCRGLRYGGECIHRPKYIVTAWAGAKAIGPRRGACGFHVGQMVKQVVEAGHAVLVERAR